MSSAKQDNATYNVISILQEWDKASKERRKQLLQDFIDQHQQITGPELEMELAQMASLFLARISVWLKLTYMTGSCLTEQLKTLHIFLNASSSQNYLSEFFEHGGILCLLEICILHHSKEIDKNWAVKVLICVSNSGTKYKEVICESYGIRAVAECMAKSKSEETQLSCRSLLEILADGNPRYLNQVYKGLIGVLPCNSPKAQQLAIQTIRTIQPLVKVAHRALIERIICLLESLHLEVQSATIELVCDLMKYEIRDDILRSLVMLLKPANEVNTQVIPLDEDGSSKPPLPIFIQQSTAAKCIRILMNRDIELSDKLIQADVVHNLLFAMGNVDYADSQRQASISLSVFCQLYPIIDENVREAMGNFLYTEFMKDPEALYVNMTPLQADVLISNKVSIKQAGLSRK